MMKITVYIVFILTFGFTSCEKILDVDFDQRDQKIVVNSFFSPDSVIRVNLSKSMGILDTASVQYIRDAQVDLYENNVFIKTLSHTDSIYGFYSDTTFYPTVGNRYTIYVQTTDGSQSVSAENSIPASVNFQITDTASVHRKDWDEVACTINLSDPGNENNYYFIELVKYFSIEYYTGESKDYKSNVYFSIDHQVIGNTTSSNSGYLFSDEMFNGKDISFNLYIDYSEITGYVSDTVPVYFLVHSVSQDYYHYISSYEKNANASENPFAEPVQVYSNVKNGYGIFAGYSTSIDSMTFIGYSGDMYYYNF